MTAVDIRPAISNDILALMKFNHGCETTHTWQVDGSSIEEGQMQVSFRKIRLPRSLQLEYPRNPEILADTWTKRGLFLVARLQTQRCGYLTLDLVENRSGRVVDLVVDEPYRRQGVACALLTAAQDWLKVNRIYQISLEIPIKNNAAIMLAEKMRYIFSGFRDCYFGNREIAFFYSAFLR